ncbi:nodulation protein NfeD [Schlegelella sp. S2-27]|uniref:Nodulation protein NfeD n=1 Tax=Caldimonas mangrovi TaxID=2944811 RepID=A0ABT0YSV0_9BURK|nr:nodulation protein NfeD [Caldimonas mangrovi]MCM5681362.1 nodulation protein NfeD [Caldimonas mangrovi]
MQLPAAKAIDMRMTARPALHAHFDPRRAALWLAVCWWVLVAAWPANGRAAPGTVSVVTIEGAIGPATAEHVRRGLDHAARDRHRLVVLAMDTPGGLDTSMRQIIKAILASEVPVAGYVSPSGARAASAGTYILYASHVAAMAPGTNLGAATPVQIGGSPQRDEGPVPGRDPAPSGSAAEKPPAGSASTRKQVNDAVAYIRGLADMRGRNAEWAERAVREAVSLPATEAQQLKVIDLVARDLQALLEQLDGRTVNVLGHDTRLETAGAAIVQHEADWRVRLLSAITDPSVALMLMMIGIYGLFFEFYNPGVGVPGVLGGICLLLALYALQLLPVNYAGLALIALGVAFMAAEAFAPSFGVLGIGGAVAFTIGAVILIDTEAPGFGIPFGLIVGLAGVSALFVAALTGMALKARRRAVVSGDEALPGSVIEVLQAGEDGAWALYAGERWRVCSDARLQPGQKVRVLSRQGLVLHVAPLDTPPQPPGG